VDRKPAPLVPDGVQQTYSVRTRSHLHSTPDRESAPSLRPPASPPLPLLLAIAGSLRAASSNVAVVAAARALAPPELEVVVYEGLGDLPHFNPDLDTESPPAAVQDLRRRVGEADALLISSPEYAHGIPGVMKNALDWLVASLEFPGKPVALVNASAASTHAQAALEEVLRTMSADLVAEACVTLPWTGAKPDLARMIEHPALSGAIREVLEALATRAAQARVACGG